MIYATCWPRLVMSLGILAGLPSYSAGQTAHSNPATVEPQLPARLEMLKLSSRLRLHAGSARQEGRLLSRSADSVGVSTPTSNVHIPLLAIDTVWVRRHHILPGMLIGTAAGAGAYYLITSSDQYDGSDTQELDNLLGAAVWVGSAVLGTVVGRLIPGWKRVFP